VPLIERLMEGLRRLLAEGGMPLNRAGATGYCDGVSLWCVAKTLAEAVRQYLAQNEEEQAGAAGIPTDNNRLFDTWQEYGALTPTPEGGAIWAVEVAIGSWRQHFTVLRFPLERLYAQPDRYPRALPPGSLAVIESKEGDSAGTVKLSGAANEMPQDGAAGDAGADVAASYETEAIETSPERRQPEAARQASGPMGTDESVLLVMPDMVEPLPTISDTGDDTNNEDVGRAQPESPARSAQASAFLPDAQSAAALLVENETTASRTGSGPVPEEVSEPVRPKQKARRPDRSITLRDGDRLPRPNAERFIAWVQEGIANGALPYNESMARVHFVPEGMLLVTPAVFRDFAQAHPEAIDQAPGEDGRVPEPWKQVQRDFQKSGYPVTADSGGAGRSFLLHYTIKGAGGRQLSVMLVPEPERFFNPVPPPNAMILSKQKPTTQNADGSAAA
jgi:hypothetical protein